MNLNQVTLTVNNMEESTDFYRRLGFLQIVDTPHYARFACPNEGATFSLSLDETDILTNISKKLSTGTTIYFEHEKLDDWVETVQSRGIEFKQLPTSQSYLWREATLVDPSGNKIKLYWAGENRLNPPWRVEKKHQQ